MKKVAILVFCLTSSWTLVSGAQDAGSCTIAAKNVEYDNSCSQCPSGDAGLADCQSARKVAGKGLVCTRDDGVEIWCSPAAVTTAKPSGCSLKTAAGSSPVGTLLTLGGLGLAVVLGGRRRRR